MEGHHSQRGQVWIYKSIDMDQFYRYPKNPNVLKYSKKIDNKDLPQATLFKHTRHGKNGYKEKLEIIHTFNNMYLLGILIQKHDNSVSERVI